MDVLGISHVVIATPNLEETASRFENLLGLRFGETIDARYFENEGNRQPARSRLSPVGIELMAPTDDAHPLSDFLAERGTSVYLVQLRVLDLETAKADLAAKGVEPIEYLAYEDDDGYYMEEYIYAPSAFGGVMFVISEYSAPHPIERPLRKAMRRPDD